MVDTSKWSKLFHPQYINRPNLGAPLCVNQMDRMVWTQQNFMTCEWPILVCIRMTYGGEINMGVPPNHLVAMDDYDKSALLLLKPMVTGRSPIALSAGWAWSKKGQSPSICSCAKKRSSRATETPTWMMIELYRLVGSTFVQDGSWLVVSKMFLSSLNI